ncbi:hypothetical protein [Aliarcobacter cryaerophilus]|uniref:hypothetical protein n=1 Tax=Aliarcobacter cryaerophilus TaxID=28198 RepID=UPI0021B4DACB|nr:hypothetical protein [Aliarcobacter cryaerophilus]MCT7530433.1 hypothetical protein [Aliarcobacter cryaerophilus]
MSKIKDKLLKDQDEYFSYLISYEEWLDRNLKPLNNNEIDRLERELQRKPFHLLVNKTLSKLSLNNVNYSNNPIGA